MNQIDINIEQTQQDIQVELSGGSVGEVIHNDTLIGSGTASNPLGVDTTLFATHTQGEKADTAIQPEDLATVATTGDYDDLINKPAIPSAQVNSDWNASSGVAEILNKPTLGTMAAESASDYTKTSELATVATTGDYDDLTNTPTIPVVNDSTITIMQGGETKGSFTLNQSSAATISLDSGGGSTYDEWGQSLQGDIVVNNTLINGAYKCFCNPLITSFSAPNVTTGIFQSTFSNCINLTRLTGFESFTTGMLSSAFSGCTGLISVPAFNGITSIDYAWANAFNGCDHLQTGPKFDNLETVNAPCNGLFTGCKMLITPPTFAKLKTINAQFQSVFKDCLLLVTLRFPALDTINNSMQNLCDGCPYLTNLYFNALTSHSFDNLVANNPFTGLLANTGTLLTHTIHFPSNMESTIQNMAGYPLF